MSVTENPQLLSTKKSVLDCKTDFPLLQNLPLHYLDNATTTHKPNRVINAISHCYRYGYGPIDRGLYPLAESATAAYERARKILSLFIGTPDPTELVFTRSATEACNMVAWGWARKRLKPGDRIWITRMEHHSNFIPWQRICQACDAELRIIELDEEGSLDLKAATDLFDIKTQLIALSHVSNVFGSEMPIQSLCRQAKAAGIPVFVDATQSVGHLPVDVKSLDCDFLVFSSHQMYGPSGIGALYGKKKRLEEMDPLLLGGGMVTQVSDHHLEWGKIPARFEAGSPNLADAVGFAQAAEYLSDQGFDFIKHHVNTLTNNTVEALSQFQDILLWPHSGVTRSSMVSFGLRGVHPQDVAQVAGEHDVPLGVGHHQCQTLMAALDIPGTIRASFGVYNTQEDINALLSAIDKARRLFR